jgi:hypothetical protein
MSVQAVMPIPEGLRATLRKRLEDEREKAQNAPDPAGRLRAGVLLDAIGPTLTGEALAGCLLMVAPEGDPKEAKEEANVVLFGLGIKDSRKLEVALRDALAQAKPEEREKVALDHDRGAGATSIHRVEVDAKDLQKQAFGKPYMFAAFPEGAAFVAVGGNGLPVIKDALTAFVAPPAAEAPRPQVEADCSAARFARLRVEGVTESFREASRQAFTGPTANLDHLQLSLIARPDHVSLRLDADLQVLRFLYLLGNLQQKRNAVQNQ